MEKDYLQLALRKFNTDKPNWYGWKTHDNSGNQIPNNQRMTYANIKLNYKSLREEFVGTGTLQLKITCYQNILIHM